MEKIYSDIALRIKKVRKQRKLTQKKLGEMINIPRATLANYEIGRKRIPLHHLQALEQALKCNLYPHLGQIPAAAVIENHLASLAGLLADARYLPTIPRLSFEGLNGMDLRGQRLLPFPEVAAKEADFAIATGNKESMNMYLLKKGGSPETEDLVCVEKKEYIPEEKNYETSYTIEKFQEYLQYKKEIRELKFQSRQVKRVIGIVKGVLQTGKFMPLSTVKYININADSIQSLSGPSST